MELPPQPKISKNIALHAVKEDYDQGEGVSKEEFALLTKQFQKFLKNKNFRGKSGLTSKMLNLTFHLEKILRLIKLKMLLTRENVMNLQGMAMKLRSVQTL